jgi:hypothetical protein
MFSARHYIVLSGLCGSNIFFTFSQKRQIFWEEIIEHKTCFFINFFFAALCKKFLTVIKIPRDIIVCVKQPLFLTNFKQI